MTEDARLVDAVKGVAVECDGGRLTLSCADAFALAEDLGAELLDVARVCNKHGIKIAKCQLGCFK